MQVFLFLYDDLMLRETQDKANLKLKFLSAGVINAKRYRLNDTKKYRTFVLEKHTTNLIYGGIFLLDEYEFNKHKLHAWYNNSMPFTNQTMKEDLYDMSLLQATPIKFKNDVHEHTVGKPINAICFIGNMKNEQVKRCVGLRYWSLKGSDYESIYKMVDEN